MLEIAQNGLGTIVSASDQTGRVVRIHPNGYRDVIASKGLTHPDGMTVGPEGAVYVSSCRTCPGKGDVVRIPVS